MGIKIKEVQNESNQSKNNDGTRKEDSKVWLDCYRWSYQKWRLLQCGSETGGVM